MEKKRVIVEDIFITFGKVKLLIIILFSFSLTCYSQEITPVSVYVNFARFTEKVDCVSADEHGNVIEGVYKDYYLRLETGIDYQLSRLEKLSIGLFYAYNKIWFDNSMSIIGIRAKYDILPKSVIERTSGMFNVYAIGKAGLGYDGSDWATINDYVQLGLGIGIEAYPLKKLAVFVNYDYSWFDLGRYTHKRFNQNFIHFGLRIRPSLNGFK